MLGDRAWEQEFKKVKVSQPVIKQIFFRRGEGGGAISVNFPPFKYIIFSISVTLKLPSAFLLNPKFRINWSAG